MALYRNNHVRGSYCKIYATANNKQGAALKNKG
jgi:hypothetical protein